MPSNSKDYMTNYMKEYIKNSPYMTCPICGSKIKKYLKTLHNKTKKHINKIPQN
jgi:DNA-directed RNA polymerase subunit RPC12/RpoP